MEHARRSGVIERFPRPEEVRANLEKLLESTAFRGSKRCVRFLDYVVQKTLDGAGDSLKERTIAIEVFGRAMDAELSDDTIVRVGAREVRKRLAQYYVSPESAGATLRIELAAGSYVPEFLELAGTPATISAPTVPAVPAVSASAPVSRNRNRALLAISVIAISSLAVFEARRGATDLEEFWGPVLGADPTVLVGVPNPIVYQPTRNTILRNNKLIGEHSLEQAPLKIPPQELSGSDMVAIDDQFVGFGDLAACGDLAAFLGRSRKVPKFRLAKRLQFSDLNEHPTVLVGGFTNLWTMELQQKLRFRFSWSPDHHPQIEEQGTQHRWSLPVVSDDGTTKEDYLLVTRIFSNANGKPYVILAGLKQTGTEAAGKLLTEHGRMKRFLDKLPAGWQTRNIQMVLRANVVTGAAAEPELIAHFVW